MKKWVISLISILSLISIQKVNATNIYNNPLYIKNVTNNTFNVGKNLGYYTSTTQMKEIMIRPLTINSNLENYESQKFTAGDYHIDFSFALVTNYNVPLAEVRMVINQGGTNIVQTCDTLNDNNNFAIIPNMDNISSVNNKDIQWWYFSCDSTLIFQDINSWDFYIKYIDNTVGPVAFMSSSYCIGEGIEGCNIAIQEMFENINEEFNKNFEMQMQDASNLSNALSTEHGIISASKTMFEDYESSLNFNIDTNTSNYLWTIANMILNINPLLIGTFTLCMSIGIIKLVLNR